MKNQIVKLSAVALLFLGGAAHAGEQMLGYVKSAETLPEGAKEFYQFVTTRWDKGAGHYRAYNTTTELEWGVTNRFSSSVAMLGQSIDTSGLMVDGYLPGANDYGWKFSGLEVGGKYNFLSPALDDFGLSAAVNAEYLTLDPHSGHDKNTFSVSFDLLAQKYFLEGQLVWMGNVSLEATRAKRDHIDGLPQGFDWPEEAEMEIEYTFGTGMTYRFANNWYAGVETQYQQERETEVDIERWSWFAGPSVHYAHKQWWVTLSWFEQLSGGGETFPEQNDMDLHLVEKTKHELRLKFGYDF